MANTMNTNGRPVRKSLAEQLDRLEGVIENLSDGLNQTIAEVVKQAVTVAVQQAIEGIAQAVMHNPDLLRQLVPPPRHQPEPGPGQSSQLMRAWRWLRAKLSSLGSSIKGKVRGLGSSIGTKLSSARAKARGFFPGLREAARALWRLRRPVVLSLVIGLAVGGIGIVSGPVIATALLGLTTAALSMTGFVMMPFVRLMRAMQVES